MEDRFSPLGPCGCCLCLRAPVFFSLGDDSVNSLVPQPVCLLGYTLTQIYLVPEPFFLDKQAEHVNKMLTTTVASFSPIQFQESEGLVTIEL